MSYTMYTPLNVWLDPASVTDVVAYIQTYLRDNPIYSTTEIETLIHDYLIAHPELIGGVQSVNGKTGTVVLSASDINTENDVTIESVLAALSSQISTIAGNVSTNTTNISNLTGRVSTAETDISNLKSNLDNIAEEAEVETEITYTSIGGYYINSSTEKYGTASATAFFMNYIPITSGTVYHVTATPIKSGDSTYGLMAWSTDAPGQGVSLTTVVAGSTTSTSIDTEFTAPANGYLSIATMANVSTVIHFYSVGSEYQVITDTALTDATLPANSASVGTAIKLSTDTLTIQLFGDSITDNTWGDTKTWANYITSEITRRPNISITNSAEAGYCYRTPNTGVTDTSITNMIIGENSVLNTDADVVVILCGTNDWGGNYTTLGTFLSDDTQTIYGAVSEICKYVSTNSASLLIIATPPQRYNTTDQSRDVDDYGRPINDQGYSLEELCNAVVETCEYYGIPTVDLYHMLGWNIYNVANFTTDGLHPNDAGDLRIAKAICDVINRYI